MQNSADRMYMHGWDMHSNTQQYPHVLMFPAELISREIE